MGKCYTKKSVHNECFEFVYEAIYISALDLQFWKWILLISAANVKLKTQN